MKALFRYILLGSLCGGIFLSLSAQIPALQKRLDDALTAEARLEAMLLLGEAYLDVKVDSSYLMATQARELARRLEKMGEEAEAELLLAAVEEIRGNWQPAEALNRLAAEKVIALGDAIGEGRSWAQLAQLYVRRGEPDSARLYFGRATEAFSRSSQPQLATQVHLDHGEFLRIEEDYKPARKQAELALELTDGYRNRALQARGHLLLGRIHRDAGQLSSSLDQFRKALLLFERLEDKVAQASTLKGLAQVQMEKGQTAVAIDYAEKGLALAKETETAAEAMDLYGILGELMAKEEKFDQALDYNRLKEVLRDSLLGEAASGDLASIVNKYEQEKLRLENERVAQENELNETKIALQEQEIQFQQTRMYAVLGALALMVIFGIILVYANIQRKRANRRLAQALADLQRTQTQLVWSEKLASLGQVTAGIAHEIRNPLNFVNNLSQLSVGMVDELGEELEEIKGKPFEGQDAEIVEEYFDDIRANAGKIHSHGQRATRIVQDMLAHAGNAEQDKVLVEVSELAEEYLQMAFHGLKSRKPDFECGMQFEGAEGLPAIPAARADLGRAFLNIFSNAFEAVQDRGAAGGEVRVQVHAVGGDIRISIRDTGSGISPDNLALIFDPFFTTKSPQEGTGLGLSLAHETIVKGHGGRIEVDSKVGEGTEFRIFLPAK